MIKILRILLIITCGLSPLLLAETVLDTHVKPSAITGMQSLNQLIDSGHVSIDYQISPEDNIVLYQPVTIHVEVATDSWFAKGSSIQDFQMDDAVVYRSSQNSINSSRKVAGKNWAVQNWSLVFYPQKPGILIIPTLKLSISVNAENSQIIEGEHILAERQITVELPSDMQDIEQWVATTELTVNEEYQGLKDQYRAGDAITRTITLQLNNAPAMMLPTLTAAPINGLGLYVVPPKISDKSNRGELLGELQQEFIYTIEKSGNYQLPAYRIHWWDINQKTLQTETLAALKFSTSDQADQARKNRSIAHYSGLWKAALSVLLIVVCMLIIVQMLRHYKLDSKSNLNSPQEKAIIKDFWQAYHEQNWPLLLQCLYSLMGCDTKISRSVTLEEGYVHNERCYQIVQRLNQAAFGDNKEVLFLSKADAKLLVENLAPSEKRMWLWQQPVNLTLNK